MSTSRAAKTCEGCGFEVDTADGNYLTIGDTIEHVDCLTAAYFRGRRDGYKATVRQIRDATRALKGGRDA